MARLGAQTIFLFSLKGAADAVACLVFRGWSGVGGVRPASQNTAAADFHIQTL